MEDGSFDLITSLRFYLSDPHSVPCPEAELADEDAENGELSLGQVNQILDPIVDAVAVSPAAIGKPANLDNTIYLLKHFTHIPPPAAAKLLDTLTSSLASEVDETHRDLEAEEQDSFEIHRQTLEVYAFLLQWATSATEARSLEKGAASAATTRRGGKGAKSKTSKSSSSSLDPSTWLLSDLDVKAKLLKLKLSKILITTSERDTFIGMITRPVFLLLENEAHVKNTALKMHAFKLLCLAVKHHGHALSVQTSIMQSLSYFEHLSEPMAEFLRILSEQFDYPQLSDEILRELSGKEFNSNDTKGPKSVASFLIKLSEVSPRLVIRQVTLFVKQLDSESYALRCAIIEVCGNLITDLVKQDERSESHKSQIDSFYDLLEERFLDVNPYCRSRLMQVMSRLCDLEVKNPKRRQRAAELATRSLEDKSSNVRRNTIKLLSKLVSTHPFNVLHGGQLTLKDWSVRLDKVEQELNNLQPPQPQETGTEAGNESTIGDGLLEEATNADIEDPEAPKETPTSPKTGTEDAPMENLATSEAISKLQLTRKYYLDAIQFIETIHKASWFVMQLLVSRNKGEVIEAMDFFVVLDAYKVETASLGIRKMLRLVWTKGNSDEGRSVQGHLIDCYKLLYFDAPTTFSPSDAANYVARNIISLTFGASSGDLTSLEHLLSTMMKANQISEAVIHKLWKVYGIQKKEISATQRRGAIICLGMLATADPSIIIKELETILRIGLGSMGKSDLSLAKYSCVALKNIRQSGRKLGGDNLGLPKLQNDHAVLVKLVNIVNEAPDCDDWSALVEQAINAIYALSKHPDVLCSEIIRRKSKVVFGTTPSPVPDEPVAEENGDPDHEPAVKTVPAAGGVSGLCQLLFLVGHVGIKQIVHLETCEVEFKKRKALADKTGKGEGGEAASKSSEPTGESELDLIGGTNEDDFADAMQHIRERELLFGQHSILSNFGPMVSEICSSNMLFKSAATLCMAKLMCVSAEYCEKNLPLLITIMEKSTSPTIRSNVVIALGDMAVCFNHLIDENTDFLYRRLSDRDSSVKRTCLMTLTFLILAGQIKVKGQLGEMAKCLEDGDKKISDLAKMFFSELATKDNAVYNHFVDIFSLLTSDPSIDEETFKRIIKFLMTFIEKDKHAKQLGEKLSARLARCETERQWNDVAYALSLLQHKNEDIQKLVTAGFRLVESTA